MKYCKSRLLKICKFSAMSCMAVVFSTTISVPAALYTWDGGGTTDSWGEAANWNPDVAPSPLGGTNDLQFAGSTRLGATMGSVFNLHSIAFNAGAGAFVLTNTAGGSSLRIQGGGVTNNTVGVVQTVNVASIVLGTSQTWEAAAGGLAFSGNTVNLGGNTLTLSGADSHLIAATLSGVGGRIIKNGGGIATISGGSPNTYSGGVTVNAGTVVAGKLNAFGSGAINVANVGTLNVGSFTHTVGTVTNAGIINGSGGLTSATSYRLAGGTVNATLGGNASLTAQSGFTSTLNNANNYSGGTTVDGHLRVGNSSGSATGNGGVRISSTGKLSGNGIISQTVTNNGGTVSSGGNGVEVLNVQNMQLNADSQIEIDIANVSGSHDQIIGSGTLSGNATTLDPIVVRVFGNPSGWNSSLNQSFTIGTFANISGLDATKFVVDPSNFLAPLDGGSFALELQGNQFLNLTFTAVPEPSTFALIAMGGAAILVRRRTKK